MRFSILLATTAAFAASASLAQTATPPSPAPQTTVPATATPPADEPQPMTPTTAVPAPVQSSPATGAPASITGAAVIATTATTLVQPAVGVTVFDPAGAKVGTIKAMAAQIATITTARGDVRLALSAIGPGPNGAVIGGTAAEIEAAAERAAAPPASTARTPRRAPRHR